MTCIHCGQKLRDEPVDGLLVDERTGDWWCRANPSNGGDAAPHEKPSTNAYERACEAEDALGRLQVSTSQIDLLNVVRAIVDDLDHLSEEEHRDLIAEAYNHLVAQPGGVDFDVKVGEFYYSTVRDAVTEALQAAFPTPFEIED